VLVALRTPLEGLVAVADIAEEVQLVLGREQRGADGVHGRVAPPLIVEPTRGVEVREELAVRLAAPEVEIANLKVAPDCGSGVSWGVFTGKTTGVSLQWQRL